jgi:hypothetical protein
MRQSNTLHKPGWGASGAAQHILININKFHNSYYRGNHMKNKLFYIAILACTTQALLGTSEEKPTAKPRTLPPLNGARRASLPLPETFPAHVDRRSSLPETTPVAEVPMLPGMIPAPEDIGAGVGIRARAVAADARAGAGVGAPAIAGARVRVLAAVRVGAEVAARQNQERINLPEIAPLVTPLGAEDPRYAHVRRWLPGVCVPLLKFDPSLRVRLQIDHNEAPTFAYLYKMGRKIYAVVPSRGWCHTFYKLTNAGFVIQDENFSCTMRYMFSMDKCMTYGSLTEINNRLRSINKAFNNAPERRPLKITYFDMGRKNPQYTITQRNGRLYAYKSHLNREAIPEERIARFKNSIFKIVLDTLAFPERLIDFSYESEGCCVIS